MHTLLGCYIEPLSWHGCFLNTFRLWEFMYPGIQQSMNRYLAINTTIKVNQSNCSHWFYFIVATCFGPHLGLSSGSLTKYINCNQEQIRHKCPQRRNTKYTLQKKQNHGDIPKNTRGNKVKLTKLSLKASITYSITVNPRRTTYNVGQECKNMKFYIQWPRSF
jgi:hypothetical protein